MNRINSRFNSFSRDPIPTEREGGSRVNKNRINSRFNSLKKEILYQLLQLNFGQLHLKRLHEKSREEKGKESEGWRR